ncbi:hypothetical protein [Amycolatopsis saalfeldensis]|uniref:Uncharacterized protein n=1 Tax=Amycolatopsis saalfeldensis TaxID=394193 RepID=A0A1H8YKU6_9PSEU|nr:hypothetical protein [Amycolatopsis saalfeldensis]SEP52777.1 hypothetical protein SAMN04489732_12262 [Amycolatopsis saalfeldensis]
MTAAVASAPRHRSILLLMLLALVLGGTFPSAATVSNTSAGAHPARAAAPAPAAVPGHRPALHAPHPLPFAEPPAVVPPPRPAVGVVVAETRLAAPFRPVRAPEARGPPLS